MEDKWAMLESIVRRVVREELACAKKHRVVKLPDDTGPTIENIPLNSGEWPARQSFVQEMERLYPAVDVPATLREIRAWCIANPTKRKTQAGVKRFINSWFRREQDRE